MKYYPLMIRARRANWSNSVELAGLVDQRSSNDAPQVAAPLTLNPAEPEMEVKPFAALDPQAAQVLMDDLWDAGLRPTQGLGSAGALAATQNHLADLQRLINWAYDPDVQAKMQRLYGEQGDG